LRKTLSPTNCCGDDFIVPEKEVDKENAFSHICTFLIKKKSNK
jgi:hypothetical protein